MHKRKEQVLDVVRYSKSIGIALNNTETSYFEGRNVQIQGKTCVNFALCDYLGLSTDLRLREASAQATLSNGVYTAVSRTYMKLGIYRETEEMISSIFGQPVIVVPRTTLGHLCALPVVTEKDDLLILDHQVHTSVELGARLATTYGAQLDMVRHNRIDLLEQKIIEGSSKHRNIWYLADGIYSMYGDSMPVNEVMALLDKYPNFHLYVDDAHGMSWIGENGKGFFLSMTDFHPRLLLSTSLGKGFGSGGGVLICPNEEIREQIEILGVPLMFSSPVTPGTLGAIQASARIHTSPEIYTLQDHLSEKILLTQKTARELELPVIGDELTPITFIASGKPDMTSDICKQMLLRGHYLTGGVFPAVPFNNAGIRIVTTMHQTADDITNMLTALKEEYIKAMEERKISLKDVLSGYKRKNDSPAAEGNDE